jgi:hypothetical protein
MYFPDMVLSSALATGTSSSEAPPELAANTWHDGHQTLAVGSEFLCDFVWRPLRDGTQQPRTISYDENEYSFFGRCSRAGRDFSGVAKRERRRGSRRQPRATIRYRGVAARGNSAAHQCSRNHVVPEWRPRLSFVSQRRRNRFARCKLYRQLITFTKSQTQSTGRGTRPACPSVSTCIDLSSLPSRDLSN